MFSLLRLFLNLSVRGDAGFLAQKSLLSISLVLFLAFAAWSPDCSVVASSMHWVPIMFESISSFSVHCFPFHHVFKLHLFFCFFFPCNLSLFNTDHLKLGLLYLFKHSLFSQILWSSLKYRNFTFTGAGQDWFLEFRKKWLTLLSNGWIKELNWKFRS